MKQGFKSPRQLDDEEFARRLDIPEKTERLYKWMLPNLRTSVQEKSWPVGVGEWTPEEDVQLCRSGWHGVEERHVLNYLPNTIGATLWVVETRGLVVNDDDKFAAQQMRLVHEVGTTTEQNLRLFAADCAEDVLDLFEDLRPNDTRPREAIEAVRRFARGEIDAAARAAAGAAAGDAAWDAAWAAAWERYSNWLVVRLESGY